MLDEKKLECMKDVVELGRKVGKVKMNQLSLHSPRNATVFSVFLPDDVLKDVNAELIDYSDHPEVYGSEHVFACTDVGSTHLVAVSTWGLK